MAQGKKYQVNETDRRLVEQMSAVGITQEQIAAVIKISADTLSKYYSEELETAATKATAKIAGQLYNKAMKGDTACMIFWLKTRAGWRETTHHEVTGKNGQEIVPVINIKLKD